MIDSLQPPKVFVVHEPLKKQVSSEGVVEWVRTRDITVAREYGDLVYVYPAGHLTQDPAAMVKVAREKLADFTDQDYLLLSGDTAGMAIASVIAAQQLEGNTINYLVWDGRQKRYFKLSADVWENAPEEDLVS